MCIYTHIYIYRERERQRARERERERHIYIYIYIVVCVFMYLCMISSSSSSSSICIISISISIIWCYVYLFIHWFIYPGSRNSLWSLEVLDTIEYLPICLKPRLDSGIFSAKVSSKKIVVSYPTSKEIIISLKIDQYENVCPPRKIQRMTQTSSGERTREKTM